MGKETNISWADATQNFWEGCLKVSAGCKFCYMYRWIDGRWKKDASIVRRTSPANFNKPLSWKNPRIIFTCSLSDFFIKEADAWRKDAWDIMKKTPQHTWLILTKRPERIKQCLPEDWGKGWDNVILGVSIENQKTAHYRCGKLFDVPCKHRMLSIEPILSEINILPYLKLVLDEEKPVFPFDWVIVGGESGNETGPYQYRPAKQEWLESIVDQCRHIGTPVFVKQLGTHLAKELKLKDKIGSDTTEPHYPDKLKYRQTPRYIDLLVKGGTEPDYKQEE